MTATASLNFITIWLLDDHYICTVLSLDYQFIILIIYYYSAIVFETLFHGTNQLYGSRRFHGTHRNIIPWH